MPITTSVPSDLLRPGTYQEFDVQSAQRGLVPVRRRVVLIGAMKTGAVATALVAQQMSSVSDAEVQFGIGSELTLMIKAAFKAAALYGKSPEIWAIPIADPGGGVKLIKTLTVTGTATASGNAQVSIAGRPIVFGIRVGDVQNTIAANLNKAILAKQNDLPVVPTVATNVSTLTGVNAGVNGQDIVVTADKTVAGVTITPATGTPGSGAYDITTALDVLIDKTYHARAIANHTATDVTKYGAHLDSVNGPDVKKFGMAYLAETGTLSAGTTLATGGNRMDLSVISAESFPNLPGEIAANVATTVEAEEDTALSFNNVPLDLYLPPQAAVPTNAEVETALAAGAFILGVNEVAGKARIIRAVTTKTTLNGATFLAVLDTPVVRTLFWLADQVDQRWRIDFPRAKKSERTRKRVYSSTLDVLKKAEEIERIQNVDLHAAELVVEPDVINTGRYNVSIPASVIPPLHQIVGHHVLLLE